MLYFSLCVEKQGKCSDLLLVYVGVGTFKKRCLFLAKRGRRPRVAGFIILSLKGLRRDEISCGVSVTFIYLFIYLSVRLVYAGNDVTRPCARGLMV